MEMILNSRRAILRTGAIGALLIFGGLGASAQDKGQPRRGAIEVPCCRCIDGKTTTVDLHTGTAPWTSTTGNVVTLPGPVPGWSSKPPAKWIYTGSNAVGSYTYNLRISVPDCVIPMEVTFKGTAFGDNNIVVKLDEKTLGTTPVSSGGQANYGFRDPYGVVVGGTLSPGDHVLSVTVRNDEGPTGFLFNGTLTYKCSSGPLTKK